MDIATFIKTRRNELELSLADLARLITVHGYSTEKQTVSHWEHGRNNPPIEQARFRVALALALEVDVNELLEKTGFIRPLSSRSKASALGAEIIESLDEETQQTALELLKALAKVK